MSNAQPQVHTNTSPQDQTSRDLVKQELAKLLADPDINHHALLEHLTNNFCQVRVRNDDGGTIFVSVSKTRGQGQDGPFKIDPRNSETWSRLPFLEVTIRVSNGGGEFDHLKVTLSLGTNSFKVEGGSIKGA